MGVRQYLSRLIFKRSGGAESLSPSSRHFPFSRGAESLSLQTNSLQSELQPPIHSSTMFFNEELECCVCCYEYSRSDRVPRVLHCGHTFCAPCLEKLCKQDGFIRSVSCPMCRWITCTRASLTLSGSLWVNTDIWDHIVEEEQARNQQMAQDSNDTKSTLIQSTLSLSRHSGLMSSSRHSGLMSALQKVFSCVLHKQ